MNGKDLIIILSQNNTPLASTYIRSQDVQTDADMLEKASETQQKWKEFECGRLSWQATVNYLVMTAPQIKDLLYTGQKFDVVIKNVDDDTNTLSGTAWMKSAKQTATVGNICQGVFTLQGTGALV
jgi:hypothetical protein